MINKNILTKRRLKILKEIENDSLLILFSGRNRDDNYPFLVNRNFFYLSNFSQENSFIVLLKKNNITEEYIFVEKNNKKLEKWIGKKMSVSEIAMLSGINKKNFFINDSFDRKIKSLLIQRKIKNIYFDFSDNEEIVTKIKEKIDNSIYKIRDCSEVIIHSRMIKEKCEINDIVEAIKITKLGFEEIFAKLKYAKKEFEIYNAFNHVILDNGTHEIAFNSIIASGINTCCLHYPKPYSQIKKNSLILCDVGAAYNHYASDITRTFPVNGKFSKEQKEIYEIVLNCNKKIISLIKPGVTIKYLQKKAKEFLAKQCIEKKIIKKSGEIKKYYYHNVSHHLGLEVHDSSFKNEPLKKGMVITVEPGLYIEKKMIGVRIEDDVLVTESGSKCLSSMIPKEIKDIEMHLKSNQIKKNYNA